MKKILSIFVINKGFCESELRVREKGETDVQLIFDGYDSGLISEKTVYHSMQELHKKLDIRNIKLLCNCFRYDIRPSNMSIEMGGGIKAYKLKLSEPTKMEDLVNIFDPTDDINSIVTFEEQNEYYSKWLNSLGL